MDGETVGILKMERRLEKMKTSRLVQNYRDLEIYQSCFHFQQAIFVMSRKFPKEEIYSLTDQLRRSSRSIAANLAEAWSKRRYEAHFLSKLTDSDGELQETTHWLRTAYSCEYVTKSECEILIQQATQIGKMLGSMIASYRDFCSKPSRPTD